MNNFSLDFVKRIVAAGCLLMTVGCTFSSHIDKNVYWQMNDEIAVLPAAHVSGGDPYLGYEEIVRQKGLFKELVEKSSSPISVQIETQIGGAPNLGQAFAWLLVSGCTAYIVPYRGDLWRGATFTVFVEGKPVRTYEYENIKSTWIWLFAAPLVNERNDEYYVEELIADQFVNSFIVDLLNDKETLALIRSAADNPPHSEERQAG